MLTNLAADVDAFTSNAFLVSADSSANRSSSEGRSPSGRASGQGPRADGQRPRDDGERTVLVDPGNEFDVVSAVEAATDGLDAVVLTHTHPDHVGNVPAVAEAFDADVWGFDPDNDLVDHAIADDETVRLGDNDYRALHTPGHKDDHLCFLRGDGAVLFAGDLVFANGGFGRTDLEEGDHGQLVDSIERVLAATDDRLRNLHTGHGPSVESDARAHVELALRSARMSR